MRKQLTLLFFAGMTSVVMAQKKPLDHSVYDQWQSMGERKISADGRWALYTVDVQEGDGTLYLQQTDGSGKRAFPRGYGGEISRDGRFAIFKIKAPYAETRRARIQKKKPDEMPKDSLAIVLLGTDSIIRIPGVKSFRMPKEGDEWLAIHLERRPADSAFNGSKKDDPKPLRKSDFFNTDGGMDAIAANQLDAEGDAPATGSQEGTEVLLRNLKSGFERKFPLVSDLLWSKNGRLLLLKGTASKAVKGSMPVMLVYRTIEDYLDTISRGGNEYRSMAVDEAGRQIVFTAERDSSGKSLQRFHKLWYWKNGFDSARLLVDRNTVGMPLNWTISEYASLSFSPSGKRIFFGTAPVRAPRDTSLVEMDLVRLDVWHYEDEYLQPQQLRNLDRELKRSYAAVWHVDAGRMVQLADRDMPQVMMSGEGDGNLFAGITDKATRKQSQWRGRTFDDVYALDPNDGRRTIIIKGLNGNAQTSPEGKFIWWYDAASRRYYTWSNGKSVMISAKVPVALHDERFDMPDDPSPYGPVRWIENDESVLVYDRFDIWQLDPMGIKPPVCVTGCAGRKNGIVYRYLPTDPEERSLKPGQVLLLRSFNENTKASGFARLTLGSHQAPESLLSGAYSVGMPIKAKDAERYLFTRETYVNPPDLYASMDLRSDLRLSAINPQQADYNWGTAELFRWKAYNGKDAVGILYKPADFDPKKKYPLISYFYERLSDGLHSYLPPAPTPSRLNISFFVSRGYLVLAPDIIYTKGYPGKSAFDYIVSGVRAVVKKGWADSTRLGLQGQSWGGYQTAHIITRTPLFRAAWAGAPVANMTSAYGGIRWESGINRQFQYEHSQSRIGATLWENPKLYIENSPLFHLPRNKTPLVIMANDADGAVPWYQGIEMFTAMRRLGQQVWMLNYNGEAHNLVERRNRKDIQIREQQFFDWLLKGDKPAKWITEGVPATEKGREWGLGY
jgi:dipeptidyl aminopeptidase/acylaminoacyl peptidase